MHIPTLTITRYQVPLLTFMYALQLFLTRKTVCIIAELTVAQSSLTSILNLQGSKIIK